MNFKVVLSFGRMANVNKHCVLQQSHKATRRSDRMTTNRRFQWPNARRPEMFDVLAHSQCEHVRGTTSTSDPPKNVVWTLRFPFGCYLFFYIFYSLEPVPYFHLVLLCDHPKSLHAVIPVENICNVGMVWSHPKSLPRFSFSRPIFQNYLI